MKIKQNLYLMISIILIFIFPSCNLIASIITPKGEDKDIGEFEDINIFDSSLLPDDNSFITAYSIIGDKEYLYAITDGSEEAPGKLVKIKKNGETPIIKTLVEEAIQAGFTDSHAYYLKSVNFCDNQLIIKAVPNIIQFEHGIFEVFSLRPDDLSIQWRWVPNENGKIDYHIIGDTNIELWKDYFLIYYADETKEEGFYFVFLDINGHQIIKKFIKGSYPKNEGDLCIIEDKLLLHQKYEPLVIYDLNKLLDSNYDSNDCIDFMFIGEDYEANMFSNIVSDGKNCYFCSWKHINRETCETALIVFAVSLTDYSTLWSYELNNPNYDGVNSILLNKNQLFLAADYGCVYSIDVTNGNLLWKTELVDKDHQINLLVEGCILEKYFVIPSGSNGYLYYLDQKNGKIVGKYYIPVFGGKRHCYVENEYLYITSGSYIVRLKLKEK